MVGRKKRVKEGCKMFKKRQIEIINFYSIYRFFHEFRTRLVKKEQHKW